MENPLEEVLYQKARHIVAQAYHVDLVQRHGQGLGRRAGQLRGLEEAPLRLRENRMDIHSSGSQHLCTFFFMARTMVAPSKTVAGHSYTWLHQTPRYKDAEPGLLENRDEMGLGAAEMRRKRGSCFKCSELLWTLDSCLRYAVP